MAEEPRRTAPDDGPLPRPSIAGPGGERGRIAGPEDTPLVALLMRRFLEETGQPADEDRISWVAQTLTREPLRGFSAIAFEKGPGARAPLALAAVVNSLDPADGWSGRFRCLYVLPEHRRRGVGRWLLGESIEYARYHGINSLVFEMDPAEDVVRRLLAGFSSRERRIRLAEITLRPHFDDSTNSTK